MKDGVVYDTDTAGALHSANPFVGEVHAVTPEGHYFKAVFGGFALGRVIFPLTRRGAVEFAIKHKADDYVLRRLGVAIQKPIKAGDPYDQLSARFIWMKPRFLGKDWLLQNHDGRYFLLKNRRISRCRWQITRPMDQKKALRWALRNYADNEAVRKLGLAVESCETRFLLP